MATTEGTDAIAGKRDFAAVKRALAAAGYKGEPVVFLDPTDYPATHAMALVMADAFQKCGLNVDLVSTDWGWPSSTLGRGRRPHAADPARQLHFAVQYGRPPARP